MELIKTLVILFCNCCKFEFKEVFCTVVNNVWHDDLFLDPPTVTIQQSSYSVTSGNSVTLVCTVTSNLPITSVQWQRNVGGTITTINSNTNTNKYSGSTTTTPSLTIFSAAQSDAGTYTCFGTNSVGTGQSSTTQLSITESMSIFKTISVTNVNFVFLSIFVSCFLNMINISCYNMLCSSKHTTEPD